MGNFNLEEIRQLSVAERLQLVSDIWDSIPENSHPPLTSAQREELDRRLDDTADDAVPWEEVRASIQNRLQKTRL